MIHNMTNIHPEAQIGANVQIGPFVHIDKNVVIGEGTVIASNVSILDGARIGKNCRIFSGAVIAAIPQDLKFRGEETIAEIGDNTTIRECVTVNRGTASKGKTVVGNNCLLMAYTHVAHDCVVGNSVILGNATQLAGEVIIHDHAILSGGILVHQFCSIGVHVIIQGGSRITKDVPPFVTAGRDPLSYAGINTIGLRRRGYTNEQIQSIQDMYRIIYASGLNNTQALEKLQQDISPSAEKDEVINFLQSSERGIIKGYFDK
jgi:UDP-N-acetylglucosamine acyltransferase